MHLGEAEQIPENTTENAVGNKVATLAPFEGEENKESEKKLKGEKEDKGAEIIANAKKGDLTSTGDHVDVLKQHIEDHGLCLVFRELTGTVGIVQAPTKWFCTTCLNFLEITRLCDSW